MKHRNLGKISEREKLKRTPSQQPAKFKKTDEAKAGAEVKLCFGERPVAVGDLVIIPAGTLRVEALPAKRGDPVVMARPAGGNDRFDYDPSVLGMRWVET